MLPVPVYRYLAAVACCTSFRDHLTVDRKGPYDSQFGPIIPMTDAVRRSAQQLSIHAGAIDKKQAALSRNVLVAVGILTPAHMECLGRFLTTNKSWGKQPMALELGDSLLGQHPSSATRDLLGQVATDLYKALSPSRRGVRAPRRKPARITADDWLIHCAVQDENRRRAERSETIEAAIRRWRTAIPTALHGGSERQDMIEQLLRGSEKLRPVTAADYVLAGPDLNDDGTVQRGGRAERYAALAIPPATGDELPAVWPARDCSYNPQWSGQRLAEVRKAVMLGTPMPPAAEALPYTGLTRPFSVEGGGELPEVVAGQQNDEDVFPAFQPSDLPLDQMAPVIELRPRPAEPVLQADEDALLPVPAGALRRRRPSGGKAVEAWCEDNADGQEWLGECWNRLTAGFRERFDDRGTVDPRRKGSFNASLVQLLTTGDAITRAELVDAVMAFAADHIRPTQPSTEQLAVEVKRIRRRSQHRYSNPAIEAAKQGAGAAVVDDSGNEAVLAAIAEIAALNTEFFSAIPPTPDPLVSAPVRRGDLLISEVMAR